MFFVVTKIIPPFCGSITGCSAMVVDAALFISQI